MIKRQFLLGYSRFFSLLCFLIVHSFDSFAKNTDKYPSFVDLSGKASSSRNIGEFDLFAPMSQKPSSLVFLNLRSQADNQQSNEQNLGIGYRKLYRNSQNFLSKSFVSGSYLYIDKRRSKNNNDFYQSTLGAELLSEWFDFRTNIYIPFNKEERIPVQNVRLTSNGGVTISYENKERALYGSDIEVGTKVPWFLPFKEGENEVRFYLGYYYFNQSQVEKVAGPRARVEFRFDEVNKFAKFLPKNSRLTLGAEIQHDDVRGEQKYLVGRIRIPLNFGKSSKLKGIERRMVDPVVRDVDIVTNNVTSSEQALFADSETEVSSVSSVGDGVELYKSTTKGSENSLVIVNGDISTSLEINLQKGQKILGPGSIVPLRTPSGIVLNYKIAGSGGATIENTVPGQNAFNPSLNSSTSNIYAKQVDTSNGNSTSKGVLLSIRPNITLNPGVSTSSGTEFAQVQALVFDGGNVSYSCVSGCANISVDATTGKISTNGTGLSSSEQFEFTLKASSSNGGTAEQEYYGLSESGVVSAKAATSSSGILPNSETYKGITLVYGNDFKCGGDEDTFSGTCNSTTVTTKIQHVKDIIDALLYHDNTNKGGEIQAQLEANGATLSLFNDFTDSSSTQAESYLEYNPITQDLQAEETFVGAPNNKGLATSKNSGGVFARNAAIEEIVHLIHNYGIAHAYPEVQEKIDNLTRSALGTSFNGISGDNKLSWIDANKDLIDDTGDLDRQSLDDEFLADSVESYFNARGGEGQIKTTSVCSSGGNGGVGIVTCSTSTSRQDLQNNFSEMYDVVEDLFGSRSSLCDAGLGLSCN